MIKLLKIFGLLSLASIAITVMSYSAFYFQIGMIVWLPFAYIFSCAGGVYTFFKIIDVVES